VENYRYFDHTGDVGVEVFGESLAALFSHAGEAFADIITDAETIRARDEKKIDLQADSIEELLVRWLNELVFLFDTRGLLPTNFTIDFIDHRHLQATVRGESYDEKRHPIKTTIKGATYHQLEVIREQEIWSARIVFDL